MKLRKKKKSIKRLASRIKDWENIIRSKGNEKAYRKPGRGY